MIVQPGALFHRIGPIFFSVAIGPSILEAMDFLWGEVSDLTIRPPFGQYHRSTKAMDARNSTTNANEFLAAAAGSLPF